MLLRRQLIGWVVRWVASFALIGLVIYLTPDSGWLWWLVIVGAGLSLAYILTLAVLSRRRVDRARAHLSAAEEFAKCLDEARKR